jgi:nitrogen regulatory protein P-II 1
MMEAMIKIEVVISQNDIKAASDSLKHINVVRKHISKVKGRVKSIVSQLHGSQGTGMYRPGFGNKYKLEVR